MPRSRHSYHKMSQRRYRMGSSSSKSKPAHRNSPSKSHQSRRSRHTHDRNKFSSRKLAADREKYSRAYKKLREIKRLQHHLEEQARKILMDMKKSI